MSDLIGEVDTIEAFLLFVGLFKLFKFFVVVEDAHKMLLFGMGCTCKLTLSVLELLCSCYLQVVIHF